MNEYPCHASLNDPKNQKMIPYKSGSSVMKRNAGSCNQLIFNECSNDSELRTFVVRQELRAKVEESEYLRP